MRLSLSDESEDEGVAIMSRDALYNGIGVMFILVVLAIAAIAPPTAETKHESVPPGNIIIEAYWPDEINADVDLWVKGPEGNPIGFSNLAGVHYNLLRDDLGQVNTHDPVNYEVAYSRGIPTGGHCVNVHLYSNSSTVYPVPVKISVKIVDGDPGKEVKGTGTPLLVSDVELEVDKQEKNVFCFITNDDGTMMEGEGSVYQSDAICLRGPNC